MHAVGDHTNVFYYFFELSESATNCVVRGLSLWLVRTSKPLILHTSPQLPLVQLCSTSDLL